MKALRKVLRLFNRLRYGRAINIAEKWADENWDMQERFLDEDDGLAEIYEERAMLAEEISREIKALKF